MPGRARRAGGVMPEFPCGCQHPMSAHCAAGEDGKEDSPDPAAHKFHPSIPRGCLPRAPRAALTFKRSCRPRCIPVGSTGSLPDAPCRRWGVDGEQSQRWGAPYILLPAVPSPWLELSCLERQVARWSALS